ncbi:MFS transporter [Rubrivivax rivuli]|uniref:MFS transporter n=2 Tax=Rubrivivax rivuli TaxID=1862385 RepID=A0A437RLZ5_9BURK|nr:MFS transporter [Rubrivivax rivuli]
MLGAVVVLTTSTLNRVMVVELALPALLPGLLVALHYAVQLSRPRMGYGSDVGGRRTPWILGGIGVLALGGFGAAVATTWMNTARGPGIALAVFSFALVGVGVSAGGTSLLVLLAKRVDAPRRASAAALVWVMMIVGFAVTAGLAGRFLDPYTPVRLMAVSGTVSLVAVVVAALALWGLEGHGRSVPPAQKARPDFAAALREVWREPDARRFTIFVFVSMLAYSTQDLILEPFAGAVFGFTPGASTQLSGVQHGGTLMGMLLAALAGRRVAGARLGSLRAWTVGGCIASGLALLGLVVAGSMAPNWPLRANVFVLGVANGAFSIAAIGSMMSLAGGATATGEAREGTRMGLWGAAQAIGFAVGGLFGAAASDVARWLIGDMGTAYAAVFALEAGMFVAAAMLAARIGGPLLSAPAAPSSEPLAAPLVGTADTQALRAGGS